MWIKAQDGKIYNASQFGGFISNVEHGGIKNILYGTSRQGNTVLLQYTSFENRNFISVAMKRIENGLKNNSNFVDLSDICKRDYTDDEIKKAHLAMRPSVNKSCQASA